MKSSVGRASLPAKIDIMVRKTHNAHKNRDLRPLLKPLTVILGEQSDRRIS